MAFSRLTELRITHDYYQGICEDLRVEVIGSSKGLLKMGEIKTLTTPGYLCLYFDTDKQIHSLNVLNGQQITLAVVPGSSEFSVITETGIADNTIAVYKNSSVPTGLDTPQYYQKLSEYFAGLNIPENTIALIELTLDSSFFTTVAEYTLNYTARADTLNYYVVASNYSSNDFSKLALADAGFSEQSRSEIIFLRTESADFTDNHINADLLNNNGNKVALFHSQSPVSRRRQGPKKLQLRLNGETLISSLPIPGSNSVEADFFIHVAKP